MKTAVLISGGVDSSVALRILKEQGYNDLTAFYLKIWLEEDLSFLGQCPWTEDINYIEKVCKQANVPLKIISLQKEYWDKVISYAIGELKEGRTPSPDLFCNQQIKFGSFFDKIDKSFEKVATGHYAQIEQINSQFLLKKAKDPVKDQTYFLSLLTQEQISRALFPIGHLLKSEVRELAQKYDLPNKEREESQGICFLGKIKYSDFIKHHLGIQKGDLLEFETNKKVGEHEGFWFYTIGQRKGIGLSGGPWYVVAKDCKKNVIYVSKHYFSKDKKRDQFEVSKFNWISGQEPMKKDLGVKVRHGEHFYKCKLELVKKDHGVVKIEGQDQGIASGQFAVFYDEDVCLGCGVIV